MLYSGNKYLVTGATGFLGRALIKRLVSQGFTRISAMSRNEGELMKLKQQYPEIEIIPGDVSNAAACEKATADVSGIFHLAAFKHVGLAEKHVSRCILSNIGGTMNLLETTVHNRPDFIIGISTDKAAQVSGVYGATKLLMERLFSEFEAFNERTKYRTVRYGNVLDSTGSVTTIWREKMKAGEEVIATDLNATRFYWTVDQAVDLIFDCLQNATDARPHHFPMKAMRLGDLLDAMMEKYGQSPVKIIGLQPGENMHEVIMADGGDSSQAPRYTKKEIMELI